MKFYFLIYKYFNIILDKHYFMASLIKFKIIHFNKEIKQKTNFDYCIHFSIVYFYNLHEYISFEFIR